MCGCGRSFTTLSTEFCLSSLAVPCFTPSVYLFISIGFQSNSRSQLFLASSPCPERNQPTVLIRTNNGAVWSGIRFVDKTRIWSPQLDIFTGYWSVFWSHERTVNMAVAARSCFCINCWCHFSNCFDSGRSIKVELEHDWILLDPTKRQSSSNNKFKSTCSLIQTLSKGGGGGVLNIGTVASCFSMFKL